MLKSMWRCCAVLAVITAPMLGAQGAVSGQVGLLERDGEKTEDLSDVVVWLEPAGGRSPRTVPGTSTIQLQGRQFAPRIRAVTEGSTINFPNLDSFSHNVFSKAPDGAFDTGVFPRGRNKDQTFKETGVFPIYCNIHPRMTGYVVVLKTPWYASAGDDGRFSVPSVPSGNYTLHVWHDRVAQEYTKSIVVPASGFSAGRVEMDARGYRYVQHKNKFGQEYANAAGDRY